MGAGTETGDGLPLGRALALHLLPGALQMAAYAALAPLLIRSGVPGELGFTLAVLVAGLPCMLAVVWAHGGLRAIRYRRPMPAWLYAVLFLAGLVLAFGLLFATAPLSAFLAENVFSWLPGYLRPGWEPPVPPVRSLVLLALLLRLAVDGLAAPVVEEVYFRGLLLPRLEWLGALAPALCALLFTVQHLWQPYNWPLIFLLNVPMMYVVRWRQNIYISMLLHCSTNTIAALLALIGFLSA
jgi:membrane protease YdiL (CAAX protease family)